MAKQRWLGRQSVIVKPHQRPRFGKLEGLRRQGGSRRFVVALAIQSGAAAMSETSGGADFSSTGVGALAVPIVPPLESVWMHVRASASVGTCSKHGVVSNRL